MLLAFPWGREARVWPLDQCTLGYGTEIKFGYVELLLLLTFERSFHRWLRCAV